jgi:hypothetical protein
MGILIGMDEAGYGPNLGPLVVAATAWEVGAGGWGQGAERGGRGLEAGSGESASASGNGRTPGIALKSPGKMPGLCETDLYRSLRSVVSRSPSEQRIAIADSKLLYRPGPGLRHLERGVHAALLALEQSVASWSAFVDYCGADPDGHYQRLCWHDGVDCLLPVDASAEELARLGARLARACKGAGVRPLLIRARLVFPAELNELIDYFGSKGAALSHVTIGLLRDVLELVRRESPGGPVAVATSPPPAPSPQPPVPSPPPPAPSPQPPTFVVCDKHGGRNRYAALLQHFFPDQWIETVVEGRAESWYRWGPAGADVEVTFRVGGEAFLPTALASMTAKYLRELAMRAFNHFWCARVLGLRPTAGYPSDSRRFHNDIRSVQRTLGIDDHILWRCR